MTLFTSVQHESAREELIAAYEGFIPRHSDYYTSHGMYAVENETRAFQQAIFKALGIEGDKALAKTLKSKNSTHIVKGTQRIRGGSKPLVNDMVFKQSGLLRSLDTLNPVAKAWITAAYLSQDKEPLIKMMVELYSQQNKIRKGTESKIEIMVMAAIQSALNDALGLGVACDAEIARLMGVSRQSFRESWAVRLHDMRILLKAIDIQCLNQVCQHLGFKRYKPSLKSRHSNAKNLIVGPCA